MEKSGRISIPRRFISEPNEVFVLTKGEDSWFVVVHRLKDWEKILEKAANNPIISMYFKETLESASKVQIFSRCRIVVPSHLRQYAGIKDEATVVGSNSNFEIWDGRRWRDDLTEPAPPDGEIISLLD